MTVARTRAAGAVFAAAACATTLSLTPAFQSGIRALIAEVQLIAGEDPGLGLVMGGTGNPLPDPEYIDDVKGLYLAPFSSYTIQGLPTPEQFCPIVCLPPPNPQLTFDASVNQGVGDLHTAILSGLHQGDVAVLGYSQSATVATVEMNQLLNNTPSGVDLSDLHFTLLGDPNSPIGGILDRFQFPDGVGAFSLSPEPQHVPFLDIPLSLAPTPTGLATDIYTGEYDGWANFPEDPSNLWADINALIGIETVHPSYPELPPDTNFIDLGTIGQTHFHDFAEPLPTLAFMADGGPAGQFFYDAFSPFARLVDDWGYGNPGDPFVGVNGIDAIGPWQVDAAGHLMASGVDGFIPKMDPLQMLAGMEYAAAQTFIRPTDDLLQAAGQPFLPDSAVTSLLSLYELTNQLDQSMLTTWADLTASMPSLAPDVVFDGSPLISGQPLIDLVGYGFDAFNFFGA